MSGASIVLDFDPQEMSAGAPEVAGSNPAGQAIQPLETNDCPERTAASHLGSAQQGTSANEGSNPSGAAFTVCYTPCAKHMGVPVTMRIGWSPPVKQMCPVCEPPTEYQSIDAQGFPVKATEKPCTCHPDDNPPWPCPGKYALSECRVAAEASGQYRTYPGEPLAGIYEAGVAIVRLGKDDEATGE